MTGNKQLNPQQEIDLLHLLGQRFAANSHRHSNIDWSQIVVRLSDYPAKLWTLFQMEASGGEPDVIGYDAKSGEYLFVDCAAESPKGRRSLCYDRAALDARKEFKPENSVMDMAEAMGVELLNEQHYRELQLLGSFDTKTSSWIATPADIRKLGGALFAEFRYGHVFVFHNGAQSYYAARGFRGLLRV